MAILKQTDNPINVGGRPKREFTDEEVAKIYDAALNNCHLDTIALALDIPKSTLDRRFGTKIRQLRAKGRMKLRSNQVRLSRLSSDMAKFLGKNELGQVDKQEIKTTQVVTEVPEAEREAYEDAANTIKLKLSRTSPVKAGS